MRTHPTQIYSITEKDFVQLNNYVVIDVREPYELEDGALSDAINIPLQDLLDNKFDLDKNKEIVIYCRSGGRSQKAMDHLVAQGFKAHNLGGYLFFSDELKSK